MINCFPLQKHAGEFFQSLLPAEGSDSSLLCTQAECDKTGLKPETGIHLRALYRTSPLTTCGGSLPTNVANIHPNNRELHRVSLMFLVEDICWKKNLCSF